MSHYFSRITLTEDGIRELSRNGPVDSYNIHREMWSLFPDGPDKDRDFVYAVSEGGRRIYCVSDRVPQCDSKKWLIETKPYDPTIQEGDVYRFHTCVNPTVANSNTGKHQRHDVVMDLKRRIRESGENVPMHDIIQRSVTDWFIRKGTLNGFEPVNGPELLISSYRHHESYKAGVHKIVYSSVDIDGYVRVTDPDRFRQMLFRGLGSAKGFGCGMFMIMRP